VTGPANLSRSHAVAGLFAFLARWYPGSASGSDDLRRSLSFLGWPVEARTVVEAGYVAGGLAVALSTPLALVAPPPYRPAALPVTLVVGLGAVHAVHRMPVALATLRRTTALGEAPGVVARAVLRMRIAPTVESAAAFAAASGEGPLADSLDRHVDRAAGTPRSGLSGFAEEWAEWFPALRRSAGLVVAAADAPAGERGRTLDRALTAVLDGTRERMAEFAGTVRAPATALYAFGVLLPLALVAVLPAARVAGVPVSVELLALVYDGLLPAVVLGASAWLLVRRPVAFPPPAVDRTHPAVPSRRWPAACLGLCAGAVALAGLPAIAPDWVGPVGAVGIGVGVALVALYRPVAAVRRRVRAVESGLSDALYLVGRRIAEGEAVETAIERAATELSGETGETFGAAAAVGRRLRVDVEASFLGEYGALDDVPSPRARGTAALLSAAADEGRPAGSAVVAMADHLAELEAVEAEARRELARVTGTLRQTAAVFAPLVAGATVSLAGGIDLGGTAEGSLGGATGTVPTAALGTAIGVYVLFLAAALTVLATGLERGLDPALVGYRLGRALLSAVAVFVGAVVAVGALV
jgi:Flp pilus assembly protein TadB